MNSWIEIETIEVAGFGAAVKTLRLPYGLQVRSKVYPHKAAIMHDDIITWFPYTHVHLDERDLTLMQSLIRKGDEHAKFNRMIQVWCNITAPRYWWQEMVTYEVGVTKGCSNSTMHQECRGLKGEDLVEVKERLTEGTLQTRTYCFTYQALRRICHQRDGHRLPHWGEFIDWCRTLPMAEQLIFTTEI